MSHKMCLNVFFKVPLLSIYSFNSTWSNDRNTKESITLCRHSDIVDSYPRHQFSEKTVVTSMPLLSTSYQLSTTGSMLSEKLVWCFLFVLCVCACVFFSLCRETLVLPSPDLITYFTWNLTLATRRFQSHCKLHRSKQPHNSALAPA